MIDRLLNFFGVSEEEVSGDTGEARIQHATAVLLVEIARADYERLSLEHDAMLELLKSCFSLSVVEAERVLDHAETAAENSVSLHEFTRVLHDELSYSEKERVVEMLWRIALADKVLDKYEDYMVGKIADLLYVVRGDVMRLKSKVYDSLDK
ncbi:MAG: TerB family tellurite resistance protein [Gammaproteobacteria bacterium]|jgi:uncharacterized tellurite resistance protein B-like protein|nr:TerB family tellurite resistance protein [Gammaproteobacteria bacterium]